MLSQAFSDFANVLEIDNTEEIEKRVKRITKRLNEAYWQIDSNEDHRYIVGSLGRETAVKGVSDLDLLFVLPKELKQQYDNRDGNKQSQLLQDVKKEIKKTYPNTKVRGDGQVVVVTFSSVNFVAEICPAFERSDGAFDYPDSNNGGSWKKTDPLPEVNESIKTSNDSNHNYRYICNMVRAWKNNSGFKFGGLLIDTLVYQFIEDYKDYKEAKFDDYLQLFKDLFSYLKTRNKEQKYWFALGSNQKVYNKKGTFVSRAKKAYNKMENLTEESEDLYEVLQEIFGESFPVPETATESSAAKGAVFSSTVRNTEEFISNLFPIDIRFNLKIECDVTQDGWRPHKLRYMLKDKIPLFASKNLHFYIVENEFEDYIDKLIDKPSYDIYWKVLNRGDEAIKRNCIRGQIVRDKSNGNKYEATSFRGEHLVECYIVYNGTVIAKDQIMVPITTNA
ncbi:nucleotidyltransferase domain-containing protein [Paenibacillus cellulositrophicus]|uniref:nucleotide-binding domain-containing protein n=1 Tax=Paenibacillus cellulositrophicus TaxID=562959 RepID=UPI00203D14FA|nr:nucleotidyltransferase domain-containing protein [Paenibacillus cellulositrophicus]MCM2999968.1 nucleotidyltransferase domain-containing protein [Paenibacillus cellulositrophicus]